MNERDPLDDLARSWREVQPPAESERVDEREAAALAWMRAAWSQLERPSRIDAADRQPSDGRPSHQLASDEFLQGANDDPVLTWTRAAWSNVAPPAPSAERDRDPIVAWARQAWSAALVPAELRPPRRARGRLLLLVPLLASAAAIGLLLVRPDLLGTNGSGGPGSGSADGLAGGSVEVASVDDGPASSTARTGLPDAGASTSDTGAGPGSGTPRPSVQIHRDGFELRSGRVRMILIQPDLDDTNRTNGELR
ncbi:hypothetical protein [Engelhardtia mirabilis]|uniref:Uncharacterized protein n=1 Tax=Engelhardtia mirabilis TaxID=2528011 RepID=A0A518BFD8_9BACT|nr:hypothetical protein Pla133_06880 [Planctomycetes bacterium Pla133]QDU99948.1 hypothetical protein Pla86_06870 [Planctomycetes bacterium Pla86]